VAIPGFPRWRWEDVVQKNAILLLSLVVLGAAEPQAAEQSSPPASQEQTARTDAFVRQQMGAHGIPGASVGVCREGRLIYANGYGLANIEKNLPVRPNTPFQLASVTKQFTAAAMMLLVQDGRVRLKDPISAYFAGLPPAWKPVTVEQLLTHTSGIPDYLGSPRLARFTPGRDSLIQLVADRPLDFPPGQQHRYSNTGYVLLGMLVQQISGRSYDRFLTERIFGPLGMTATRRRDPRAPNLAVGYVHKAGTADLAPAPYLPPEQWDNADGGIVSTVEDMAKWEGALQSRKVLSEASLKQMWSRVRLTDGSEKDYGFGWIVNVTPKRRIIGHAGARPGVSTNFTRWPDDGITVIVLCNLKLSGPNDCYKIAAGIARVFIPDLPVP
jgi:D-alanyl-D-alanine carboxypeptidase